MNDGVKTGLILTGITAAALGVGIGLNKLPDDKDGAISSSSTPDSLQGLIGKPAADFSLKNVSGQPMTLSGLKGKNVILFFNEGIGCYPACWNQIAALKPSAELEKRDTIALSIVPDSSDSWRQATKKMPELAAATILLDTDKSVSAQYGMLTVPSSMHRGSLPGHSYVIVDKDGIVRYTRDDARMGVINSELLAEIDKLQ